jgi:kynurenine formamidase
LLPAINEEYFRTTGRRVIEDFPEWEPCHNAILSVGICGFENIGGDIDKVTGKRVTFAAFPWRWKKGDGCIVRLVAMVDPSGAFRIETGRSE